MQYKDYYKTLGVSRTASQEEIKRAYRKLARQYHPDVSKEPNAEARFKEINEANEVLKDPEKRATYDALGSGWRAGDDFRPPPGRWGDFDFKTGGASGDYSDFFSSIFGRAFRPEGRGAGRQRGQDQTITLAIDLEDSHQGATRQIKVDLPATGSNGQSSARSRTLNVRIPAGVTQGRQIRLAGQGLPGRHGGPAGDLYLEIAFKPHRLFTPDGRDIQLRLPVAPWEAALGATVQVPTLGGSVNLKIPPGSQSGRKLRLKGRGLPGTPPGDEIVQLEIVIPPAETETARDLYRRMAEQLPFDPRAQLGV
ncbi:DnaJ C-terminal domain-containing protein [Allochromatium vinosum]|uniref:Heat shock protein DnaJ domain protein n=1 Tax=Allochromatium vinosum (strain ATCC 17899 / DSM 180 / NBRC 103801 / NCIMB 10441 / D) TaxID=572477 RepID=D3RN30_ALLVD|nr:DnaJ C-terminal domain-containing protein [Allochromatium vinosum]ADC61314.1 heat shock protein DnaJ domain protein [Allochromatium vinosum DSM 180]